MYVNNVSGGKIIKNISKNGHFRGERKKVVEISVI